MGIEWPSLTRNRRGVRGAIAITLVYVPAMLLYWGHTPTVCGPAWISPAATSLIAAQAWFVALFMEPPPRPRHPVRNVLIVLGVFVAALVIIGLFPICKP